MSINYITKTTVLQRGWTPGSIKKWLGSADKYVKNPHYRSGAPVNLFNVIRVRNAEQRPDFLQWKAQTQLSRAKRSLYMKEVKANERQILFAEISATEIPIVEMSVSYLKHKANWHFEQLKYERNWADDSQTTLEKKCVNFLRHQCSPYEAKLSNLIGKTGRAEAYKLTKTKVLEGISAKYEFLRDECDMQIHSLELAAVKELST